MPIRKRGSQKRKLVSEENKSAEEESRKPTVPPLQLLMQRSGLTAAFHENVTLHCRQVQNYSGHFAGVERFLNEEVARQKAGKVLMLDVSKPDSGLCVMMQYLENAQTDHYVSSKQNQAFHLATSLETYFVHQLQTQYNPGAHSGDSLLFRLATSYERFTPDSKDKYNRIPTAWLKALGHNPLVQNKKSVSGDNILAQLAAGNCSRTMNLLMQEGCFEVVDMVFDVNAAGLNAMQMADNSVMKQKMKEFGELWSMHSRPFLFEALVEFLIPDLANSCLQFIDNGFQSQTQSPP